MGSLSAATPEQLERHSDVCAICRADLTVDATVVVTPCSHLFHARCLGRWLNRSASCPFCNTDLVEAFYSNVMGPETDVEEVAGEDSEDSERS